MSGHSAKKCNYELVVLGVVTAQCDLTRGHMKNALQANVFYVHGHRLIDVVTGRRVNAPYLCGHCGRPMGDFAGGSASVTVKRHVIIDGKDTVTPVMARVCHPNVEGRPDCYRLITVYHEVLGVRATEATLGFSEG